MADRMEIETKVIVADESKSSSSKQRIKDAKEIQKATKETSNSAQRAKKALVDAFNKNNIVGWVKLINETVNGMIKAAEKQSEYIENLNMMQVAFGDSADAATKYVESISNATGLDQNTLTRQLGIFRQISDAMGYTSDVADTLSTNLSKMSLDISSLFNVTAERAGKSLESAITGQVRSIRSLTGADITLATLQQEAYARGINKTTSEMTRAEKTILIYLSLERQLANANGDLARTINSVANQTKTFKDQIIVLGRNIGGFLIPILKTILPLLNGILMTINAIISTVLGLFGIDAESLAKEFGIASAGFENLEEDLLGIEGAANNAKKSLRGFDKLNNITTPSASNSSVGAGSGGIDAGLIAALKNYDLGNIQSKAAQIRDDIMDWLGFTKQINGEWKWAAGDLLENMLKSWSKLNKLSKVFVGIGVGVAIKKVYDWVKKIIDFTKKSKLIAGIQIIVDSLGRKGLLKTIQELMTTYPKLTKALGAGFIFTSLLEFYQVIKDIKVIVEDGISWDNFLKVLSDALTAIGLLVAGIGFFTNPAAIVAGFSIIGAGIVTGFIDKVIYGKSELEKFRDEANSDIWRDLAVYQSVQDLSGELDNYIGVNGRVQESDEKRVEYILNQMNEAFGTEYKLIDGLIYNNGELVTSYQDVEKEIDVYMAKIKAQMILERYADAYTDALLKKEEYQKLVNKENENYQENLKYINGQYDELMKKYGDEEVVQGILETARKAATDSHNTELDKLNKKYGEYIELVEQYNGLQEASYNSDMNAINEKTIEIIGSQEKTVKKALDSQTRYADSTRKIIDNILSGATTFYDLGRNNAKQYNKGFQEDLKTNYDINLRATTGMGNYTIKTKADGGFVNSGDIFVANENNRPEYVGSFGHQTAVANTDQIVDGIAIGVTKAMLATGGRDSKVVIEAKGDTSGLLDFITFEQKKKDRQYGL